MIVKRYILIRLPRIRLITYSSISSLSLVTKHQFTNNMFIFYSFIKRENSSFFYPVEGKLRKQKDSNSSMQISHFFKWKNSQLDQEFLLLICFSLKQFLISTNTWH